MHAIDLWYKMLYEFHEKDKRCFGFEVDLVSYSATIFSI
jgi:hypothetical protein